MAETNAPVVSTTPPIVDSTPSPNAPPRESNDSPAPDAYDSEPDFLESLDEAFEKNPNMAAIDDGTTRQQESPIVDPEPASKSSEAKSESKKAESKTEDSVNDFSDLDPTKDDINLEDYDPNALSDDSLNEFDEVDTSAWDEKPATAFKNIKSKLKEFQSALADKDAEIKARDARLAELDALENNPKIEEYEKQIAEYEKKLMVTNVTESKTFQETVAKPIGEIVNRVDAFASEVGIDKDELLEVIAMQGGAAQEERLDELLPNAGIRTKSDLFKLSDALMPLLTKRDELLSDVEKTAADLRELDAQQEKQTLAERAIERTKAAQMVSDRITSKLPFMESLDVNMEDITKEVSKIDFSGVDAVTGAYHATSAKLLPAIAKALHESQQKLAAANNKLGAIDAAAPKAGGPSSSGSIDDDEMDGELDFEDAVERALG